MGLCCVLDTALRPMKERVLLRPAQLVPATTSADALTAIGLAMTLCGAVAASQSAFVWALLLWAGGRLLDGIDGVFARLRSSADDVGGYFDLLADTVGYAAMPLGIAAALDTRTAWIGVAVLLASFYLNTVSWTMLSTIIDRRRITPEAATTSFTMPPALVEGTETMMFYALFLIVPTWAPTLFFVMAGAVAINVVQRLGHARTLR